MLRIRTTSRTFDERRSFYMKQKSVRLVLQGRTMCMNVILIRTTMLIDNFSTFSLSCPYTYARYPVGLAARPIFLAREAFLCIDDYLRSFTIVGTRMAHRTIFLFFYDRLPVPFWLFPKRKVGC